MDIAAWLGGLGLERYAPAFRDNDVDCEVLSDLTADDLISIGVTSVGHRRKLLSAIAALRSDAPPVAARVAPAAAVSADAERRQLTVMFCDLVGSTALAARLDPEDLREVIGAYHRAVADMVGRFDGFVAKYMGDGVLIYFGYPKAHEDDAERGVRAGLAVIEAVDRLDIKSSKVQARVGIATGLAVVGDLIGEGSAQEQSVVGETPNLAARLQALAEPDTVVISASTRRLVGDLFEYSDLGTVEVKGIAEPVPAWQVLRPSAVESRFEALRGSALSQLIGRDEEIDLLFRRWSRAKSGDGQVVLVSGEPGIGKSRITAALAERLHAEPYLRLRYFCSPYHQDSALHPFIDQLGRAAGFARGDRPAARLEKLEALLTLTAPPDEDVALLADLLSLPALERHPLPNLSPQRQKERTLEALLRQLEGLAREHAVLMVFEDAHWIDPTSRELLDLTVERVRVLPVLLIVTFRPEFQPSWAGQPQVSVLTLNRLDRHDRTALVEQVARGKALPDEVVNQIAERTDGVPLFVEELTKSVLESGTLREEGDHYVLEGRLPAFAIPTTLHASLLARLDRLASVRLVAQIGAAIGCEFGYDLLRAVSRLPEDELQGALARLVASELVFQRGTPPDVVYSFKHALVQDAAYGSLLRSSLRQLHARIGNVLVSSFPDIAETQPEIVAHHYTEAQSPADAVEYWHRAGERALQRSAHLEAESHLRRGVEGIKGVQPGRDRDRRELNLQLALASALHANRGQSAPEVGEAYDRARQLCERLDDTPQLFRVLMGLYRFSGPTEKGHNFADQLLKLAQQSQDIDLLIEGHMAYGTTQMIWGKLATALYHLDQAIKLYVPERHRSHAMRFSLDPGVNSLSRSTWVLWFLGHPDQAQERSNRTLALARELGHTHSLALALCRAAMFRQFRREPWEVQELARAAVTVCSEHQLSQWAAVGRFLLGWAIAQQGRSDEGIRQMRESLVEYQRIGTWTDLEWYFGVLAEALTANKYTGEGLAAVEEAQRVIRTTDLHAPELHRLKGDLLILERRQPEAEQSFLLALDMARRQGAKSVELRAAASFARLRRDQGRYTEGRDLLAPIYGWFTEGFGTPDLKQAKALLAELA